MYRLMKASPRKNMAVYTSSHGVSRLTFLRHQWKEAMHSPNKKTPVIRECAVWSSEFTRPFSVTVCPQTADYDFRNKKPPRKGGGQYWSNNVKRYKKNTSHNQCGNNASSSFPCKSSSPVLSQRTETAYPSPDNALFRHRLSPKKKMASTPVTEQE